MTSTALVLFMTLPGLALFYGGLVRRKNVLSVMAQCLGIAGLVTILWWLCGYSLTFSGGNGIIGTWPMHSSGVSSRQGGSRLPLDQRQYVAMFSSPSPSSPGAHRRGHRGTHEVLRHPALHHLWMFAVYFPLAHMVWSGKGMMSGALNPMPRSRRSISPGHRGAHEFGMERSGPVHHPGAAPRLRQTAHAAA
jgi:Amt family ammonium transporter